MMDWNGERVARLRTMIEDDKLSARQAAKEFGCTHNAVISAVHRNGIAFARRPSGEKKTRQGKNGGTVARINRMRFGDGPRLPASPVPTERLERATPLPFLAVELTDIEHGQCRYPHGEEHITFCGQPQREGSSYCDFHHRICRVGVSNELRYSPKTQAEHSGTSSTDRRMAGRASELAESEHDRAGDGEHQDTVGLDRLLAMGDGLPGGEHAQGSANDESVGHGGLDPWQSIGSVADRIVRRLAAR